MDGKQEQISLLKQYIATLEHENNARNEQKNTLFAQIDRLTAELAHLDSLLQNKPKSNDVALKKSEQTITSLRKQVASLQAQVRQLTSEISTLRSKTSLNDQGGDLAKLQNTVALVSSQLTHKEEQLRLIRQEKQDLQRQIDSLRSSNYQNSLTQNQVATLEKELASYKTKVSELSRQQSQSQSTSLMISQLQTSKRNLQSQLSILEAKCERLQIDSKKLQIENKELKMSNRSPSEMTNLLNSKLTLQSTIRQLTSKAEWAEGTNKNLEREKKEQQRRITELQKQLYESKGRLTQLRFNEQSFRKTEAEVAIRQKQMQALESMISNLKDNKRLLERTLKEKEDIIVGLQSQVYTFRTSNNSNSDLQRQINQLKSSKSACERQLGNVTRTNQQLSYEITHLKSQINTISIELHATIEERDSLARQRSSWLQKDQRMSAPIPEQDQSASDLRWQVQRLRMEVEELKSGNLLKSDVHHYDHSHNCRSQLHVHHKIVPDRSPVKDTHTKSHSRVVVAEKDRGGNRQKWQNLQRKISALRSENQTLKHSLFQ